MDRPGFRTLYNMDLSGPSKSRTDSGKTAPLWVDHTVIIHHQLSLTDRCLPSTAATTVWAIGPQAYIEHNQAGLANVRRE